MQGFGSNGGTSGVHTQWAKQDRPFQLSFNGLLKIDSQVSRITSDGGLVLVRELDGRLGPSELIGEYLADHRGPNSRLPRANLFRQSVYSWLAGYEDMNDAGRLWQDPTSLLIGSEKIWERGATLTSRLQSFETELLADEENLTALATISRELIGRAKAMVFRADAAFAKPGIYEALEERELKYAIRIPANENLQRDIAELLTRPVGRPSHRPLVRY